MHLLLIIVNFIFNKKKLCTKYYSFSIFFQRNTEKFLISHDPTIFLSKDLFLKEILEEQYIFHYVQNFK